MLQPDRPRRRAGWWVLGAVLLVAVLVAVLFVRGRGGDPATVPAVRPPTTTAPRAWPDPLATTGASVPCETVPWGCARAFGSWVRQAGPAANGDGVLVIGDSLVQQLQDRLVDQLAATAPVVSAGVAGSAFWHWNTGQYMGGDIEQLAQTTRSRHVVLALGNNDARLLATAGVTDQQVRDQVAWSLSTAAAGAPGCVIVVAPADWPVFGTASQRVRQAITDTVALADAGPGPDRFVLADWNAWSFAHPDWRLPGDVHLTAAGAQAYADWLAGYVRSAQAGANDC